MHAPSTPKHKTWAVGILSRSSTTPRATCRRGIQGEKLTVVPTDLDLSFFFLLRERIKKKKQVRGDELRHIALHFPRDPTGALAAAHHLTGGAHAPADGEAARRRAARPVPLAQRECAPGTTVRVDARRCHAMTINTSRVHVCVCDRRVRACGRRLYWPGMACSRPRL